MDMNHKL